MKRKGWKVYKNKLLLVKEDRGTKDLKKVHELYDRNFDKMIACFYGSDRHLRYVRRESRLNGIDKAIRRKVATFKELYAGTAAV